MKGIWRLSEWMIGAAAVILAVAAAGIMAFNGGLELEAGGVALTLQASAETGLQLVFEAQAQRF